MGKYQARICADDVLGKTPGAATAERRSPQVIFTDPEVAAVGHTLATAARPGLDVRAVDLTTSATAGASFTARDGPGHQPDGRRRGPQESWSARRSSGPRSPRSLHAATIAVVGEVPLERLWHAVPVYPTRSEVWLRLLEAYGL